MREASHKSRNENTNRRYRRIQFQYAEMMKEKTTSGLAPSYDSVISKLAEIWCFSESRIETILKMDLPDTDDGKQMPLDLKD